MSLAKPYFDEKGNPRLYDSLCLFVDILGYSERIKTAFANNTWQSEFEQFHAIVVRTIRELFLPGEFDMLHRNWEVKIFTDNIVLGHVLWPGHSESDFGAMVIQATQYQAALAQHGYFVRGGMARGMLFMDSLIAYGPALIDAYKLESTKAVVPRVVLSKDVKDLATSHTHFYADPKESPHDQFIILDRDGDGFLNYLYHYVVDENDQFSLQLDQIGRHKELIIKNLENKSLPTNVRSKFEWLAQYHNHYFRQFCDDSAFTEDLFIPAKLALHEFLPFVSPSPNLEIPD